AVLGPLLTGFVLMEYLSTRDIILFLAIATLLIADMTYLFERRMVKQSDPQRSPASAILALPAAIVLLLVIHRPLYNDFLEALHSQPKDVLEIGLASGSWSRVITAYEPVEKLTSIEINPGYLKLIAEYPEQATLLLDPKRNIYIDDGRRWLLRHPDERFDFILQNTTFHWRDHATNLLSVEYFALCKRHLKPGGVIYVNTTD